MRRLTRFPALSLLACFAAAAPLHAQEQTTNPTMQSGMPSMPLAISTDRPAITDASTDVPRGEFVFENGFTETGNQGQQGFDFPETLVRYGLTPKTELRFTPPD
jgi:hypothetical protein